MRLLLVEDDHMLGSSLKKGLEFHGYAVEWLKNGEDASAAFDGNEFDLAIFDINLPDISGIDLLRRARVHSKAKNIPVLMLTVHGDVDRKVAGLDAGADDYMTKPFDLKELLARLRALIRRKDGQTDNVLRSRDLELDNTTNVVTIRQNGKTYIPSQNELKVLKLLLQRPGSMISKEKIESELYGWEGDVASNTIEVVIYNLRRKLGKEAIVTMRGVGYMAVT